MTLSYLPQLSLRPYSSSRLSLLVVGVYKPYDVSTQLLYPWLIYYGAVAIPALVTAAILLAINLGQFKDHHTIGNLPRMFPPMFGALSRN